MGSEGITPTLGETGDHSSVCLLRPTQPSILSGMENEYQPRGSGSVLLLGR